MIRPRLVPVLFLTFAAPSSVADEFVRVPGRIWDPDTECYAGFEGTAPNFPTKRPRMIRCVDNDPACDADPQPGICAVPLSVRLNAVDPLNPRCAPAELDRYTVQNHQPDTNPRHDFGLQGLEDAVRAELPLLPSETDVLAGPVSLGLALGVAPRPGSARWLRRPTLLRAGVEAASGEVDVDRIRIVCVPDGTSSPCDGVTGTFDQIEKQLFQRRCAVPTCHSAPVSPHALSLRAGEAYAALVGMAPANVDAQLAGKLRVDPGNPGNSFLLDKLRRTLGPGEGDPMPLGLRRVRGTFLDILEDWIAAGAPEAGSVSPSDCAPGP